MVHIRLLQLVRIALLVLVALPQTPLSAAALAGSAQTEFTIPHVPAQILVRRAPGSPVTIIDQILSGLGGTVLVQSAISQIDVVGITDDGDLETAITLLRADPGIEYAEPNFTTTLWATPNDADFSFQWSKENNGVNAPSGLGHVGADMNLVSAWDTQSTANSVIVAIIDDSIETSHFDLADNVLLTGRCFASPNSARPCVNGPNDPNPVDAGDFHGTLVAGATAARGNNGIGIAGAAWETGLLPLKVDLSYYAIVEAVDEAISQGADIINMSFGGPAASQSLTDAIQRAESAGILVIASAGNADANNASASHYPSDTPLANVFSVAASDSRDRISGFSQWGSFDVHAAAPGDLVRTTANGNAYATVSGTSFSAPHTAGIAALVLENSGAADYRQIKAHMLYGTSDGRDALGPAVPGQDKRGIPGRVATGRLDADRALAGPPGGVLMIDRVQVDDTAFGNANGKLDPGETAQLQITLTNAWSTETTVTGALSSRNSAMIFVNDVTPVPFGTIAMDATATASFNVTLANTVTGNEQLFMQLDLNSVSGGTLPSRYFYLEAGTLRNAQTVSQGAQRFDWDEFQAFHIDVPAGASNLVLSTTGPGDVDLLVRYSQPPQYLITLNATPGTGFYYVDPDSTVSAGAGSDESVTVANPLPGTYHAVVVNYDQQVKTYDVTGSYSLPTAGEISFAQSTYSVQENAGNAVVAVTRTGGIGGATVEYSTSPLTASAGADYTPVSGTLTWGLGENGTKNINLPIIDDADIETMESLQLTLANVNGSKIGQNSSATLEIIDNDSVAGTVAFAQAVYTVAENAQQIQVSVARTGNSQGAASVDYATQSGQATAGADFSAANGTLTWANGESGTKLINISIINDAVDENLESFTVTLSNVQGSSIGSPGTTTVSVTDDDLVAAGSASGGGGGLGMLSLLVLLIARIRRRTTTSANGGIAG